MTRKYIARLSAGAIVALAALVLAVPADAQVSSMRGRAVDALGKPVEGADVILEFVGNMRREFRTKTDKNGEWIQAGMPAGTGRWNITVRKGEMMARVNGVPLLVGETARVPEMRLMGGEAGKQAAAIDAKAVEERLKKQAELEALLKESNADIAAGNYDAGIEKLIKLAAEIERCAVCYSKIGDAYMKKGDAASGEKFYLQAIATDETLPDPYAALATLYNSQQKFDQATRMSAKANELLAAKGGGDPNALYNEGVILWNQGKAAEAQTRFEKAIALDPTMADAHFQLGMAFVNQGKLAEAKKPFETYLKFAPNGPNAAMAKSMLAAINK
jgi:Flp pilus assembly protein TadD